jgi:hypothetical protein
MGFVVDLDKLADRLRCNWLHQLGVEQAVRWEQVQPSEQYKWLELADAARVEIATQVATYEMRDELAAAPRAAGPDSDRMRRALPEENTRGRAHSDGPETAKVAAAKNAGRAGSQKHRVFLAIAAAGSHGRTFDELRTELNMYSAQKRLHDLKLGEWVEPNGQRRPTATGTPAEVYVLSAKGRAHYEAERPAPKADLFADAGWPAPAAARASQLGA